MDVAAAVRERAIGRVLPGDDRLERTALVRDRFQDEERREDTVALGQVERDAQAARLLAADRDLAGEHLRGDVLEADRRDVERHAEARGDAVEEQRCRERFRDAAADAPANREALGEEREDAVRRDEPAARVQDTEPVAVPVAREDDVEARRREGPLRCGEILGNRLGVDAAEERADRGSRAATPR